MHEKIISLHALYPSQDGIPKDKVDRSHGPHKELSFACFDGATQNSICG